MKRIELKTLEAPDGPPIEYASVLREVVRRPLDPQRGIDITEMRSSIKLLDAIDAANGTLELEDADYAVLQNKLDKMAWNYADKRLLELIDDVTGAS